MNSKLTQNLAVKVPAITAFFWIIKILSTTVGETFADFLNSSLGFGLTKTSLVMTLFLFIALAFQLSASSYVPALYWISIVLISTVGTLLTDSLYDTFNVQHWKSIIFFGISLVLILVTWYRREGSLEMKSINTRSRELYYWLAILITFALGTAGGDVFLDDLGIQLKFSLLGYALALIMIWFLWAKKVLSSVIGFWVAYVLTRPLGAALGDFLSLPKKETGLGLGSTDTSLLFLTLIIILVAYLTITKKDKISIK